MSPIGWARGSIFAAGNAGGGELSTTATLQFAGQLTDSYELESGTEIAINAEAQGGTGYYATTFTVSNDIALQLEAWGAGGGGTRNSQGPSGGAGGYASGVYIFRAGTTYNVIVGGAGEGGSETPDNNNAYNAYNTGAGNVGALTAHVQDGAGGGGYTGIFGGTISQANALIIAGGGGGGAGAVALGGAGGGLLGNAGDTNYSGTGATQTAGGIHRGGGSSICNGSALRGGAGNQVGASGGGGYFGGAGGDDYVVPATGGAQTFSIDVTASSFSAYTLSGTDRTGSISGDNISVTIYEGDTVEFNVNAAAHPFYLKGSLGSGGSNALTGPTNNGTNNGTVSWTPSPGDADTYYYQCGAHYGMNAEFMVETPPMPTGPGAGGGGSGFIGGVTQGQTQPGSGSSAPQTSQSSYSAGVAVGGSNGGRGGGGLLILRRP